MRVVNTSAVIPLIAGLAQKACCELDESYLSLIKTAYKNEESPHGREILELIQKNAAIAKAESVPCCQDTGTCVIFMEIGQEVCWTGMALRDAVNEGVRQGYTQGYLRKSIVRDALERENTGDNTPAVLHTEIVEGNGVTITVMPKGGGSENMGAFTTLLPDAGEKGIEDFVLKTVQNAGGSPCPPLIVGIGLGGTMDMCCLLAKKALLRKPAGLQNSSRRYAVLEARLLEKINKLGIGPLGMGGRTTALAVHIEAFACHITALPVAVNLQCHSARTASASLEGAPE
ncbi:MAG: fumarate hydratase [Spirochaetaceae bacterium]|nr:fumarate hydratase [Spirochaetaceae bacterium]